MGVLSQCKQFGSQKTARYLLHLLYDWSGSSTVQSGEHKVAAAQRLLVWFSTIL